MASSLLPCELIGQDIAADQARATADQAKAATAAQAAKDQIEKDCDYSPVETNPKKLKSRLDCVQNRVAALKRKIVVERSLQATVNGAYGVASVQAQVPYQGQASAPAPVPVPDGSSYVGQSASNTPSTCGTGTGANNP